MRKVFLTVLTTLLVMTFVSTTIAQTSQVTYYNGESIPLFQGTLAYQDGFTYDSLAGYIISSDEAFYSAQYYGSRTDSPQSIKLAVLDNYVVWQFDFADQIICIDVQDSTNAYALPIDGIAYTYIIDDFSYDNAVYSNTTEATGYVENTTATVYDTTVQVAPVQVAPVQTVQVSQTQATQQNYNISSGGYSNLYNGYATYEEYLAAYTAMTSSMAAQHNAASQVISQAAVPTDSNYAEVVYVGSASTASTVSIQPTPAMTAPVGPVDNLGMIGVANNSSTVNSSTVNSSTVYDAQGYDANGYDGEGYSRDGYNINGFDREGYNRAGYNYQGFDREGYNSAGYNATGYDREGYNREGYNAAGYNRAGERL